MLKQQRRGGESAPTGGGDKSLKSMRLGRKPTTDINHLSDFTESWSTIDYGICVIEL